MPKIDPLLACVARSKNVESRIRRISAAKFSTQLSRYRNLLKAIEFIDENLSSDLDIRLCRVQCKKKKCESMRKRLELARPFVESLYILCLKIEALYKNRLPQAEMRSVYAAFRAESARVGLGNKTIDEGMTLLDRLYDLLAVNGAERLAALKAASDLPGVKSTIKLVEERFTDEYFEPARVLYQWSRDVFSVSEGYASHILQSRDESVLNVTREKCQAAASSTQLVLAEILQAAVKAGYLVDEVKKLISEICITISDEL